MQIKVMVLLEIFTYLSKLCNGSAIRYVRSDFVILDPPSPSTLYLHKRFWLIPPPPSTTVRIVRRELLYILQITINQIHLFFKKKKQSIFGPRPENCLSFSEKSPQKLFSNCLVAGLLTSIF